MKKRKIFLCKNLVAGVAGVVFGSCFLLLEQDRGFILRFCLPVWFFLDCAFWRR